MLHVSGLSKRYRERAVIEELALDVAPGEYVAIVGESGSGKSTLLNLIAGLDVADRGCIRIDGTDIAGLDDAQRTMLRRVRIGFVFQAFHVLPHLSVGQNLALPLVLGGIDARERAARTGEMLAEVGLAGRADDPPAELSGGELQRVAIARALIHRPALVLADEPTGNLDPDTAQLMLSLLAREIRSRGAAGVLVTHSEAAVATADRVLRLERGRLQARPPGQR